MKIFTLVTLLTLSISALAQQHQILDVFRVYEVNGKVHIDCTTSAGETCNGIVYYRSEDNENFEMIGQVFGTCGSPDFAVRYTHIDEEPIVNKPSFYKVNFGGWGYTESRTVTVFDFEQVGYQVRPNPVVNEAQIFFHNPSREQFELALHDLLGRIVHTDVTNDNQFHLEASNFKGGVYIFSITNVNSNKHITGKLLIK